MKKIILTLAWVMILPLVFGCAKVEYFSPDSSLIPKAADFVISHSVGEKNVVTFTMDNKGCIPMWIFGPDDIKTGNGVTRSFPEKGTYQVEVKGYNPNGISDGSKVYEFTIEESYVPPFDPTPYVAVLSSTVWVMDSDSPGHLGCGESGSVGTGWWSASPNEKADFSVYDNELTFGADGSYIFDPVDGQTYVNWGSGFRTDVWDGTENDYVAPIDVQNSTYKLSKGDDDVIYLTFPKDITVGYIPNPESLTNPVYKIISIKASSLELVIDNGGIAWHYLYKPKGQKESPDQILSGKSSKKWYFAKDIQGHLGCGEPGTDGLGWWSCGPNEKADWGMYDDVLTFYADGKYEYNPGEGGQIYVNKGVSAFSQYYLNDDQDFLVPVDGIQTSTWKMESSGADQVLVFPANTYVGYIPNDAAWNNPSFKVLSLKDETLELVIDDGGIAWHYIFISENYGGGGDDDEEEGFNPGDEVMKTLDAYKSNLLGSWTWETSTHGHFGCGDAIANPTGWWACGVDEKKDWSMYDDVMTFTADAYTFDPVDGKTYVNVGVTTYHPEANTTGADFIAPAEVMTSPWELKQGESYVELTLSTPNTLFTYLAHDEQLTNCKYYITGMWDNCVELVWYTPTGNGGGPIAWKYRLKRIK